MGVRVAHGRTNGQHPAAASNFGQSMKWAKIVATAEFAEPTFAADDHLETGQRGVLRYRPRLLM
jgi:hypothetical protein